LIDNQYVIVIIDNIELTCLYANEIERNFYVSAWYMHMFWS